MIKKILGWLILIGLFTALIVFASTTVGFMNFMISCGVTLGAFILVVKALDWICE